MWTIALGLIKRYLPQIIAAVFLVALYFYWHGHVYDAGVMNERGKWEAFEAKRQKQSTDLRLEKERQVWEAKLADRETYMRAFESYGNYIEILTADRDSHRADGLRVRTKTACDSNAVSRKTNDTEADRGRRGEVYTAELESKVAATIRDNAAEVALGAAACSQLLEAVKREFEVK